MSCCSHTVYNPDPNKKQILYWIRRYGETDPYTQGYIGITQNNLAYRVYQHKNSLSNAGKILLAGGLVSVLHEANSRTQIFSLERHYRPEHSIADNIAKGGQSIVVQHYNPHSINVSCVVCQYEFTDRKQYNNHANSFHKNPTTIYLDDRIK